MLVRSFAYITFLIIGIVVVFSLILARNSFRIQTTHADSHNLIVFDDQLAPGFSNWSWNSSVDLTESNTVYSGTKAISFTPGAWGGLYFHSSSPIDLTRYASLQFAMQGNDPEKNFTLIFYNSTNQQLSPSISLWAYPGVTQNGWKLYTIPVSAVSSPISGFALQETSGTGGSVSYFDAIQFIAQQTDLSSSYPIYVNALASGWMNWSWNSTIDFANPLLFTPARGYGGLYLHTDAGIDTTPYASLTFSAKARSDGEAFAVGVYNSSNQLLHEPLSLASYGGQPTSTSWKTYTIPLHDLQASNTLIKGVMLQDITGQAGKSVSIAQVALAASDESEQDSTDPSAASSTTALSSTPVPPSSAHIYSSTSHSANPLSGLPFFNDPDANPALQQEQQWQTTDVANAGFMAKIANQPKAIWMGDWIMNIQSAVRTIVNKAQVTHTLPVFVAYNIPHRDCGSYSAGGSASSQAYQSWIDGFAAGIGNRRAAVILEPDALAQITCLSPQDQQQRFTLLSYAVQKLKSLGQTAVYLDAGNAGWIGADAMANRLKTAAVQLADGFSLNVSNFDTDDATIAYGQQIATLLQNKHFVIDTSRNGNGPSPDNAWCNPSGRALGDKPTTQTGNPLVDAFLWVKYPGESDGTCNDGPAAGVWYPGYALSLAKNAHW